MPSRTKRDKSPKQSKKRVASAHDVTARDYPAVIAWSDEDGCYVARVPALAGCMSHGATVDEAARNILDAAEGWLDVAVRHGDRVPAPPKQASGKLVLRLPRDLHAQAAEHAAREGVSLNTWIVTAVARAEGRAES